MSAAFPVMNWLRPDWPAPAHVHALCTTRTGGRSAFPYDSLNLGDHVGDEPLAVGANRAFLAKTLGARPVFLSQVHGRRVVELDPGTPHGTEADACLTSTRGLACTIMVADCLPVLLTNREGSVVAGAHAGWRGLVGHKGMGVIEALCAEVFAVQEPVDAQQISQLAADTLVWLGPCIGPRVFEVGPEVRAAFAAHDHKALACFQPAPAPGKWRADLAGLARQRLDALGIRQIYGNDSSADWCTVSNASRFFSYRRDGRTGRMAACIWMD